MTIRKVTANVGISIGPYNFYLCFGNETLHFQKLKRPMKEKGVATSDEVKSESKNRKCRDKRWSKYIYLRKLL